MFKFRKVVLILIFSIFSFSKAGLSQSTGTADKFSGYDPNSTVRINHQPLSDYLEATVLPVGRSYRILGKEKADSYRGSRIKTAKALSPSRYEGSRLFIHAFSEDHKHFFRAYQQGLERLSNRRSLSTLNQNEQLAYWLNLYNVIVINKLVAEFPIKKLKALRSSTRGKNSFWKEKVTAVEGVSLSLIDIEKILFSNFDSPLVAFGLWQGSIGGPSLLNNSYTGRNVWRALENNAVEFVNSNRGLRPPTGSRMNVSRFYEWVMPAFGTSEEHVLMFIKEYADPNFVQGVSGVNSLKFKLYDWEIASIFGGNKHSGSSNQLGGVLRAGGNAAGGGGGPAYANHGDPSRQAGGLTGSSAFVGKQVGAGQQEYTRPFFDTMETMRIILRRTPTGAVEQLPQQAMDLIMGIKANNRLPVPIITSEECAPGETCEIENVNDEGV